MRRGLWSLAAVLGASLPVVAQDVDLRKEVEQLKEKVKSLEAREAAAAPEAKGVQMMDFEDKTVLDMLLAETKIGGFVDVGFIYNIDRPNNGTNGAVGGTFDGSVRAFDRDSRSFYLHNAQLNIARAPTKELIVGYNIELTIGADADVIAAGTDVDSTGGLGGDYFDVQEANVQILTPLGRGLLITAGKFATFAGYEVIESKDNYNYSRSLPFLFAIPFTHTGVRATYDFSDQIAASLGINNGWDNAQDNNDGKTLEFNLTVKPITWLKALVNFYYGAEKSPTTTSGRDDGDKRMLLDIVVTASDIPGLPGLTLGLNYDMGEEEDSGVLSSSGSLQDGEWTGFAAYVRYQINEQWAGAFRYSMLDDETLFRTNGSATIAKFSGGVARENTLSEITLTLEWTPVKGLKSRLEYRMDMSDEDVFRKSGNPTGNTFEDTQSTIGAEVIVEF